MLLGFTIKGPQACGATKRPWAIVRLVSRGRVYIVSDRQEYRSV